MKEEENSGGSRGVQKSPLYMVNSMPRFENTFGLKDWNGQ